MTGTDVLNSRLSLKRVGSDCSYLSQNELAKIVGVSSGRTVRKWEDGEREVPGPVAVLLLALINDPGVRSYFGVTLRENALRWPDGQPARTRKAEEK